MSPRSTLGYTDGRIRRRVHCSFFCRESRETLSISLVTTVFRDSGVIKKRPGSQTKSKSKLSRYSLLVSGHFLFPGSYLIDGNSFR